MAKKPRGTLALPEASIAKIAQLREKSGVKDDSEVVRRALRLYERLIVDAAELGVEFPPKKK